MTNENIYASMTQPLVLFSFLYHMIDIPPVYLRKKRKERKTEVKAS